ncbi:hypothetical protein DOY81_003203 [Sarcophaga bullata]|nr:hypothetical protein DOY81_003203 [Sarcophaga bullata]
MYSAETPLLKFKRCYHQASFLNNEYSFLQFQNHFGRNNNFNM